MQLQPTYNLKRKCLYCGKPIEDREHATRKFCQRVQLDDGTIINCKDSYHFNKNKPILEPFKFMAKWQRFYFERIRQLLEAEGEKVTLELINRYGINLHRPFEFKVLPDKRFIFYFHQYAIEQMPDSRYKISKHVLF